MRFPAPRDTIGSGLLVAITLAHVCHDRLSKLECALKTDLPSTEQKVKVQGIFIEKLVTSSPHLGHLQRQPLGEG